APLRLRRADLLGSLGSLGSIGALGPVQWVQRVPWVRRAHRFGWSIAPIEPIEQDLLNLLNPMNPVNLMAKRLHNGGLEVRFQIRRRRGGHQHRDEVFFRVDPEVSTRRTGPAKTAIRQPDPRLPCVRNHAYAQAPRRSRRSAG